MHLPLHLRKAAACLYYFNFLYTCNLILYFSCPPPPLIIIIIIDVFRTVCACLDGHVPCLLQQPTWMLRCNLFPVLLWFPPSSACFAVRHEQVSAKACAYFAYACVRVCIRMHLFASISRAAEHIGSAFSVLWTRQRCWLVHSSSRCRPTEVQYIKMSLSVF